jgi:hypothetical protein
MTDNSQYSSVSSGPKYKLRVPFGIITFAIIGGLYWYSSQPRFSTDSVNAMQSDIRAQFEKRPGVHVVDVKLIRESDRRVSGFVKLTFDALGADQDPMIKSCTALLGDDGKSFWTCQ